MKPNRTFSAVPEDVRDWTSFLSELFYADEFTTGLSGCATTPTGTARYTVSAGIVCLALPDLSAISNATTASLSGLPDEITPERTQQCLARIIDNGVTAVGLVQVGADGTLTLFKNLDAGAFTASGTKGMKYSVLCYPLD